MYKPSKEIKFNDSDMLENLALSVNQNNFSYNEMLKIFCNFPALYPLLEESKWDATMAYYVAHNTPEYFGAIPSHLVTKPMYQSYLMNGARKLKNEFSPVIYNEFIDLHTAMFLLRSYRIYLEEFKDEKKYKNLICKIIKRNPKFTYGDYSAVYDKIVNKLEKYVGVSYDQDILIIHLIVNNEYNFDHINNLMRLNPNAIQYCINNDFFNISKYMFDLFQKSDNIGKDKVITGYFKAHGVNSLNDLKSSYSYVEGGIFMHMITNEYIVYDYTFPNGDKLKIKHYQWITKLVQRFIKTYFKKDTK